MGRERGGTRSKGVWVDRRPDLGAACSLPRSGGPGRSFSWARGGMSVPGEGGACRTRGKPMRPSCRGRVRCARAWTGRWFLSGGEGVSVGQSRER